MIKKKLKKYEAWTEILKAIANPVRLFIIEELEKGERCVNDFNEMLYLDVSTVSRHLSTLKKAGVIDSDKRGNQVFYKLKIPCVMNFFTCTDSVVRQKIEDNMKVINETDF